MKLIALAAAFALAAPAAAQTAPMNQDVPKQQPGSNTAPQPLDAENMAGYMPTTPLYSGPVTPQTRVIFRPSTMTPDQAFPPPQPLASYPPCGPNQYDNCMQR
ncbi:hypothetical protein [Sphingosinithalassobacter sp. CS137]|uniref:hypothetical protein n=1 Tax=Sphingosinithalassobacter sp. CS137 TaxID=2762748 RepID=UPI00165E5557|nr:hypothetical protein [Sphingosinithalassobacter sp. CS137]